MKNSVFLCIFYRKQRITWFGRNIFNDNNNRINVSRYYECINLPLTNFFVFYTFMKQTILEWKLNGITITAQKYLTLSSRTQLDNQFNVSNIFLYFLSIHFLNQSFISLLWISLGVHHFFIIIIIK
jgi:hypothetical protein